MNPASPSTTTFVIRHSVGTSPEFGFGVPTGFPEGGELLSPLVIRRVQAGLLGREVQKFEDGLFHGDISRLGMYDLLAGLSVADAVAEDFHVLTDKKVKTCVYLGIRWTVSDSIKECRIFGPRSDPQNQIVVDLTKPVQE